jgi:hypothetical protein
MDERARNAPIPFRFDPVKIRGLAAPVPSGPEKGTRAHWVQQLGYGLPASVAL